MNERVFDIEELDNLLEAVRERARVTVTWRGSPEGRFYCPWPAACDSLQRATLYDGEIVFSVEVYIVDDDGEPVATLSEGVAVDVPEIVQFISGTPSLFVEGHLDDALGKVVNAMTDHKRGYLPTRVINTLDESNILDWDEPA